MNALAKADTDAVRIHINGVGGFERLLGQQLPPSPWTDVTPQRVHAFAACTGDSQPIHLDPAVARKWGFPGPIAHGLLSLSLIPALWRSIVRMDGPSIAVLYGINRVRFPATVVIPTRVRGVFEITAVDEIVDGCQIKIDAAIESEGRAKPVCTAELIVRYLSDSPHE